MALEATTTYYARARYHSQHHGVSAWGPSVKFTTGGLFPRNEIAKIMHPTPTNSSQFGASLAIANEGLFAFASEMNHTLSTPVGSVSSGQVVISALNGGTYSLHALLTAPVTDGSMRNYGWSIAISPDASHLFVTADGNSKVTGSIVVHRREGSSWPVQQIITAPNATAPNRFGRYFAVSRNGSVLVASVSSPSNQLLIFRNLAGTWTFESSYALANDSPRFNLSDDGSKLLIVYAGVAINQGGQFEEYSYNGSSWTKETTFAIASDSGANLLEMSCAVSGDGTRMVVATPYFPDGGGFLILRKIDGSWISSGSLSLVNEAGTFTGPYAVAMNRAGNFIALNGEISAGSLAALCCYSVNDSSIEYLYTLANADRESGDYFGLPVVLSADSKYLYTAAPTHTFRQGSTYVFA